MTVLKVRATDPLARERNECETRLQYLYAREAFLKFKINGVHRQIAAEERVLVSLYAQEEEESATEQAGHEPTDVPSGLDGARPQEEEQQGSM